MTTEFNTLFETVTSIAEQVDPIKLNQTLTATAEALTRTGRAVRRVAGERQPDPRRPESRRCRRSRDDNRAVADLADVYADASPDLWDGLDNAVATARTFNDAPRRHRRGADGRGRLRQRRRRQLRTRRALSGSRRRRPGADDPAARRLPRQIFCTIRNYPDVEPRVAEALGGNGYSLARRRARSLGAGNPYIYPDNLPRVNARGGPEGRPGCWQKITRDLWPAPYLVMDTGASIAPYNHVELGQPMLIDYVWGRQVGEYTINP